MREILGKLKSWIIYDADREFYAKVFPGSVGRKDLFRIRYMTHADLPAILIIEDKNYLFPWTEDVFHDCLKARYDCWVCEEEGNVLAYCIVSMAAGEAHILNLCVTPEEQGQGIGRKMLEHVIDQARNAVETIFLEVRPSNAVALALYKKLGFVEIGVRKGYYPSLTGREDALMLALGIA